MHRVVIPLADGIVIICRLAARALKKRRVRIARWKAACVALGIGSWWRGCHRRGDEVVEGVAGYLGLGMVGVLECAGSL